MKNLPSTSQLNSIQTLALPIGQKNLLCRGRKTGTSLLASLIKRSLKQAKTMTSKDYFDLKKEKYRDISCKKIKDIVVDYKYFNNSILMWLNKHYETANKSLIINDLNDYFLNAKSCIFYECFANLAWKDHYQSYAPTFKSFSALQEALHKNRPRPIAYRAGKLAHLFSKPALQKKSKAETEKKAVYDKLKAQIKAIRADANRTMFLTCFSSYRHQPKSKGILKKYYPTLVLLLDNFKKNAVLTYQTIYDTDRQRYDSLPETTMVREENKAVLEKS